MSILIVVNNPSNWPLQVAGVQTVAARSYLTDAEYLDLKNAKVFNLCRSYRYQSIGYYVSLLAEARGHRPLPSVSTIQDLKSQTLVRFISDELDSLVQKSLHSIVSSEFTLSIYFGRNVAKKYDRLALQLFNLFPAPLLRAYFVFRERWELKNIEPIAVNDVPEEHRPFVVQVGSEYFSRRHVTVRKKVPPRYDLAILHNPSEKEPPSDAKALRKFVKAAQSMGIEAELITKDDFGHLAEFDALFLRETTAVNHYTYRFARRAEAEGLVVVDDPESILKCSNKVYLAELMERHRVPAPRTWIIHKDNLTTVVQQMNFPCILKQPDSCFSQGVVRVDDPSTFEEAVDGLLDRSDLVIAQEYLPTPFDWRVGIFDRQILFVCRYYMARNHWQIIKRESTGEKRFGNFETLTAEFAPRQVTKTALRAANLIGDGLYGVDLKQIGRKCYVVEVNDNPNLDAGVEDYLLKDELYLRIMAIFLKRLDRKKEWRMGT